MIHGARSPGGNIQTKYSYKVLEIGNILLRIVNNVCKSRVYSRRFYMVDGYTALAHTKICSLFEILIKPILKALKTEG